MIKLTFNLPSFHRTGRNSFSSIREVGIEDLEYAGMRRVVLEEGTFGAFLKSLIESLDEVGYDDLDDPQVNTIFDVIGDFMAKDNGRYIVRLDDLDKDELGSRFYRGYNSYSYELVFSVAYVLNDVVFVDNIDVIWSNDDEEEEEFDTWKAK